VRTVAPLIIALTALASIAVAQQSQPPPPHKPEPPIATPSPSANRPSSQRQPNATEKPPETDNRGSEDKPVIVKVLPTPKSQEEARQERQDREDKSAADWWMVRLTAILGFIGFLQLIAFSLQARRLGQTIEEMKIATDATRKIGEGTAAQAMIMTEQKEAMDRQAEAMNDQRIATEGLRAAAEAQGNTMREQAIGVQSLAAATQRSADVAERALTELECPFVYAEVTQPGLAFIPSAHQLGSELQRSSLELSLLNFGRTPANLTRLEYQITTTPHGDIASSIDLRQVGGRELPIGTVSADEHPFTETTNLRLEFFEEEQDLVDGRRSVWFVGFVRYDDIFGNHHVTGFAKVFDRIGGRFVTRGGDAYNYARIERMDEIPTPSSMG
jgi:hypothetical protein